VRIIDPSKLSWTKPLNERKNIMEKPTTKAIPGSLEMVITHKFDAPHDLIYRMYTDPNLIPEWWGPRNLTTKVDKMGCNQGVFGDISSTIPKIIYLPSMGYTIHSYPTSRSYPLSNGKECRDM
jgi:hypothetical protein